MNTATNPNSRWPFPGHLPWGHPAELRHDHLDHEAASGREVRGRVGEDHQLFVLGGDIHDRVRYQIHEREGRPGNARSRHVAEGHWNGI